MKNMENIFGLEKNKDIFKQDIGRYVVIHNINGNNTILGRVHSVDNEWIYVKPFYGLDYTSGKPERKRIDNFTRIRKVDISIVEYTSEKNLEAYCKFSNKEAERQRGRDN